MRKILALIVIWQILGYVQTAAVWANWHAEWPKNNYRENRLDISGLSFFGYTVGIVVTPFITGFYVDGFAWDWPKVFFSEPRGKG